MGDNASAQMILSLLILATLATIYFLAGYPLLLSYLSWPQAPPIRKDPRHQPTVSVLMAVYNGEAFIRAKLETLLALHYPQSRLQIIVVSDGSTDQTAAIVREFAAQGVLLLEVPRGGKPAALNQGLLHATREILFFTDVRQPLHPDALQHLAANFADPTVGAVTGELKYLQNSAGEQADMNLYWRYELWARDRHSRIYSLFNTTGCIYALRHSLASPLPLDTLTDDAIIPLRAFFAGYRVIFDPDAIAYDYPTVAGAEFRRRMRTLAGLWQVHQRMPQLFLRSHRMRLHFLSHKTGRLLVPWSMLVTGLCTIALPASLGRTVLLGGEISVLAMAAADLWIPKGFPLKRFTSPARTFLIMNAAAMASTVVFFVSPQALWGTTRVDRLPSDS